MWLENLESGREVFITIFNQVDSGLAEKESSVSKIRSKHHGMIRNMINAAQNQEFASIYQSRVVIPIQSKLPNN